MNFRLLSPSQGCSTIIFKSSKSRWISKISLEFSTQYFIVQLFYRSIFSIVWIFEFPQKALIRLVIIILKLFNSGLLHQSSTNSSWDSSRLTSPDWLMSARPWLVLRCLIWPKWCCATCNLRTVTSQAIQLNL